MKSPLILFAILFHCGVNCNREEIYLVIETFLLEYNLNFCHFLTCWNKFEKVKIQQSISKLNIRTAFVQSPNQMNESFLNKNLVQYGYILDYTCKNYATLLRTYFNRKHFRKNRPWLILANNYNDSESYWEIVFEHIEVRMDSNIKLVVQRNQENKSFKMFDVYNPGYKLGGKPIIADIGFGNKTYVYINKDISFYKQRMNMTGLTLRSGSVIIGNRSSAPFEEYMLDVTFKEYDTMSKYHYTLFLLLEDIHRFNHTLVVYDAWFGDYQNGTDLAIGKMLYEEKMDLTCTGASQRPPRIDVYDYLMPSYHFRPNYIFRNPGVYNPFTNQFLKPFSNSSWFIILLANGLFCIILQIIFKFENAYKRSKTRYSWAITMLTTMSPLLQQGCSLVPAGLSGRVVLTTLLFMSFLLYNYYTSSILSSLLSKPPASIHNLDELGHSNLEIGIERVAYTLTWFAIMDDTNVQYIYKHKIFPPEAIDLNAYSPEEGMEKVRQGGFAYHTQLDTGYPLIARTADQDTICELSHLHMIPQVFAGHMVQKHSQYKELFHITLRMIKQAGFVDRNSQIWEAKKPECLGNARIMAVRGDQTFIAFLMLFNGIIVSLLLLVIELASVKFVNFFTCQK